ncbi:MAG: CatA-like O-acetyltransferase [Eubacteriales bacterium]
MYRKVDMEHWPRRDHYEFYTQQLGCGFSVSAELDITKFRQVQQQQGARFYAALIHCISYCVNNQEEFRLRLRDGELVAYDVVHPNYTIFHQDDHTFTDVWTEYQEEFGGFYNRVTEEMDRYAQVKGMKAKPTQPPNFFCVSCTPWLSFTGVSMIREGGMPFMPIITCGRYTLRDGRLYMPIAVTISHAVADGYHVSMLMQQLQQRMDETENWLHLE